jgi:hypothetical protein
MKPAEKLQTKSKRRARRIREIWLEIDTRIDYSPIGWMSDEELEAVAARIPRGLTTGQIAQWVRLARASVEMRNALRAAALLPTLNGQADCLSYLTFGIGIGDRKAEIANRIQRTLAQIRNALAKAEGPGTTPIPPRRE